MTAPAAGSTVSGTAVVVSAAAADNGTVAGVQFKLDGANLGAEDTATPYSITWSSTSASNGPHTLTAVARDAAGNTATATTITVTVSNTVSTPPVIDAVTGGDGATSSTTISSLAFSTTAANELLLAFVATDMIGGTNTTVTGVTGAGLTWTLVKRTNVQSGTSEVWRAFATTTLANVTVTATLSQSVVSSITVVSFSNVDTTGGGSGAIGATVSKNAASGAPTANLVTTRANSWVFGVGNDYDNAIARTVGPNQTLVSQYMPWVGDTYWVQRTAGAVAASGTTVTINDTAPTTDRYNLTLVEVRAP